MTSMKLLCELSIATIMLLATTGCFMDKMVNICPRTLFVADLQASSWQLNSLSLSGAAQYIPNHSVS